MAHAFVETNEGTSPQNNVQHGKSEDHNDRKLNNFIKEFKLDQIADKLHSEGISTDFLMAQDDQELDEIAKELTASSIQQKKLKYAVAQIKKAQIAIKTAEELAPPNNSKEQQPAQGNSGKNLFYAKVVLLGDSQVGKSSFLIRYLKGQYSDYQLSTIGATFLPRLVSMRDYTVKLEIWDPAGQEKFHSLPPLYYRGARAALIVYDITNSTTFTRAKRWIEELQRNADDDIVMVLLGNKKDLDEQRQVDTDEAQKYADDHHLHFIEASAKTGENVNAAFFECAKRIPKARMVMPVEKPLIASEQQESRKSKCC